MCIYKCASFIILLLSGLGYHEDLKTRTSFIEVLTSILQQGAQFSSLAETALADRLNLILELVTSETPDGDIPLVMALIDSVPPEHVVSRQYSIQCVYMYDSTWNYMCRDTRYGHRKAIQLPSYNPVT